MLAQNTLRISEKETQIPPEYRFVVLIIYLIGSAILNLLAFMFLTKKAVYMCTQIGSIVISCLLCWWSLSLAFLSWVDFFEYSQYYPVGSKTILLLITIYLSLSIVFLIFYLIIFIMNTKENIPYMEIVHKYLLINEIIIIAVLVFLLIKKWKLQL